MITRIIVAFVLGLIIYLTAVCMTVYDGIITVLLAPIFGSILVGIILFLSLVLGSPLLIESIWAKYSKISGYVYIATAIGVFLMVVSWMPSNRVPGITEEGIKFENFNPIYATTGFCIFIFSTLWNPGIGFSKNKKWL